MTMRPFKSGVAVGLSLVLSLPLLASAQEASPEPTAAVDVSAIDVSAIDAETLRALCVTRATDERARTSCLEVVGSILAPLLGLAVERSGEVAEAQPGLEAPGPYGVGDWIVIQEEGADALRLKVTKVKQTASLKEKGYRWKPDRPGNVFLSAFFRAQGLGTTPAEAPWFGDVYVDGEPGGASTYSLQPEFRGGTLRAGQSTSGWVTYEVPKRGEVIASNPYFAVLPIEIVLREK
jgi:hypothetical protein